MGLTEKQGRKHGSGTNKTSQRNLLNFVHSENYSEHASKAGKACIEKHPDKWKDMHKDPEKNAISRREGIRNSLKHKESSRKMCIERNKNNPPMLGKKRPKHSKLMRGDRNPNWCGGRSYEPYGEEFNKALKEQIRERDTYKCQECYIHQGDLGYKLHIHHIDFNKKNNEPINLISLCKSCHSQTFYNRENWVSYYKQKVSEGAVI